MKKTLDLMTEAEVKKKVKNILKQYEICYFMPSANIYGKRGIGDFVCCCNGSYIEIEAKAEIVGCKLKPLQKKHKNEICSSNGSYCVVYNNSSLRDLESFIKELLRFLHLPL